MPCEGSRNVREARSEGWTSSRKQAGQAIEICDYQHQLKLTLAKQELSTNYSNRLAAFEHGLSKAFRLMLRLLRNQKGAIGCCCMD